MAKRVYVIEGNRRPKRWKIEGLNGLFNFRVMAGKKPSKNKDDVIARFQLYPNSNFQVAYFYPSQSIPAEKVKIPVEKCIISGKQHFRVRWGTGWECLPGEEWTEEMEAKAKEILVKKHITEIEFAFV
jgi:hypothetical protein